MGVFAYNDLYFDSNRPCPYAPMIKCRDILYDKSRTSVSIQALGVRPATLKIRRHLLLSHYTKAFRFTHVASRGGGGE